MKLVFDTLKLLEKTKREDENMEIFSHESFLDIIRKPSLGRPAYAQLPKKIVMSSEMLGLIVGEGHIDDHRFIIANSEEKIILEIFNFLSQFPHKVSAYVEVCTKNTNKNFPNKCKIFWENKLKIKLRSIRISKVYFNTTKSGVLHVELNSGIIARLLAFIVEKGKTMAENNPKLAEGYLRGIFAGEGNVNVKKNDGCVYMLRISAKKKKDRNHYKKCLKTVGINISCKDMPSVSKQEGVKRGWKTTKGRAGAVIISRWNNFVRAIEINLFELHPKKEKLFFNKFKNNKFTKQFLAFEFFIDKEFTQKDAQIRFSLLGRNVNRLKRLCVSGFAQRKKQGKKYVYRLTSKYLSLYTLIVKGS